MGETRRGRHNAAAVDSSHRYAWIHTTLLSDYNLNVFSRGAIDLEAARQSIPSDFGHVSSSVFATTGIISDSEPV